MPRSSRRRAAGPNEERQRQLREQSYEATPDPNPVWSPPRPGEWWALAPSSVIHMIAKVNDKLRVTYVIPLCGGKPSQARVEVPYDQLRDNPDIQRQVCHDCWTDLRAEGISILRYADRTEFSGEEITHALNLLETFA